MHKNPFIPQPSYTHHQPPLPPGPPPAQPPAQDYSAYWAAAAAAQNAAAHPQAPTVGAYNTQWQPPQPAQPPRPTPEQSALYANYGYGPNWRPQAPAAPQPPPQTQYMQPPQPTPVAAAPQPFVPYQPQVPYQPYVPQAGAPSQTFTPAPPQQPQFAPPQQPRGLQHTPPNSFPPAKRQRFDGPNQPQMRSPLQQQSPPFGAPSGPSFNNNNNNGAFNVGPGRGGPPLGPANQRGRGGGMMGGPRGRGGPMGAMGSMNNNRGGFGNRNMRMGPSFGNNMPRGGVLPLRGQPSRGTFGNMSNQNNRGRVPFNNAGPNNNIRGRGPMHGIPSKPLGARDTMNTSMSSLSGKKDENKRTLTDFKMIGFELLELEWEWGAKPARKMAVEGLDKSDADAGAEAAHTEPHGDDTALQPAEVKTEEDVEGADAALKTEDTQQEAHDPEANGQSSGTALPPKPITQPIPLPPKPVFDENSTPAPEVSAPQAIPTGPRADAAVPAPPPRIRLYFHTPAAADQGGSFTYGPVSDSRKGKRKKIEDDDGDDAEDERKRPLPPHLANSYHDDRSSVAASVAPSVAEGSEGGDWLMAAITEGTSQESHGSEAGAPMSEDGMNGDVGVHAPDAPGENGDRALISTSTATTTASSGPTAEGHDVDAAVSGGGGPDAPMDMSAPQAPSVRDQGADQPRPTDVQVPTEPNSPAKGPMPMQSEPAPLTLDQESQANHASDVEPSQGTQPPESQLVESQGTEPDDFVAETQPETINPEATAPSQTPAGDAQPADSAAAEPSLTKTDAPVRTPSANRLSISYAGGTRRLIIDAESVQHLKLYRKEGRMEVLINVEKVDGDLQGVLVECLTEPETLYLTMQTITEMAEKDPTIPPLARLTTFPAQLTLIAYLDTERPLSEAKWARSGDVHEWLKTMFGRMFWSPGGADNGWEKRIIVMDPDPLPTIWTVLEGWATGATVGTAVERQRFLKTHMNDSDNILEILLRLVRGERATSHTQNSIHIASLSGPILAAYSEHPAHANQQTHVSLAVISLFRMLLEYARKAIGEPAKKEVEERLGEIIKCIPNHLVHKSLDGIFKEWKAEKRGR
ncbi:hypothetical protein HDZ31DRAFT_46182 [Schizophyllum fasciatum]